IIEHQLTGHLDVAGSLFDRVLVTLSLPVTFFEAGDAAGGVAPLSGQVGDPRIGVFARVIGQPYRSRFSISVGANLWIPLRAMTDSIAAQESDQGVRFAPKVV